MNPAIAGRRLHLRTAATMTGESLTLVSGVTYNAAGAMTAFTRNDGSGTNVTNSYTFNHL